MDAQIQVSALGAIVALVVAIILILKKVSPAYGMIAGALIGGLSRRSGYNQYGDLNDGRG